MSAETHEYLEPAWLANPFSSAPALRHSSYSGYVDGSIVRLLETRAVDPFAEEAHERFREVVLGSRFPCLGARSAIRRGTYRIGSYERLDDPDVTEGLARDLYAFVCERRGFRSDFTTFVAFFRSPRIRSERMFERRLWSQLQRLHDVDAPVHRWDSRVASDPNSPDFSFSIGGQAFFVIGLHEGATRTARRFRWPALVFNAHEQFEHLRTIGSFAPLQTQIRRREISLDGSINANLADFGTQSEARQYSGRPVSTEWTCPFMART